MPRELSHGNWLNLLDDIKTYLSSDDYFNIHQKQQRRKGFISYAWDPDAEKNKVLQSWLSDLRNDLKHAALTEGIFLDIFNMHGDLKDSMLTGLKTSDVIFFICNPRFKARLAEGSNCGLVQMTEQPTSDSIKALKLSYEHVYVRVRALGGVNELYYKTSWGSVTNITPKSQQALDEFDKAIGISSATHRQLTAQELQSITAIMGHAHNNLAFEVHTVLQEAAKRQAQGQEPLKIIAILQAGDKASALPEQLEAYPLIDFAQLPDDRLHDGYHKRITGFRKSDGLIPYIQEIQEADVDYTRILYRHYLSVVPRAPRLFGREEELKSLNSLVANNRVSFLQADEGIGVSTLAQNFASFCYQPNEQRIAQHSQHYPIVRYLNAKEQDFDEFTKEIAQELAVSDENWWDELLALPVPWLMVLDGDVTWEPRSSNAKHRLLRVKTPVSAPASTPTVATTAPNPAYVITLAPLGDEARLQMVRYYLTGSNELKDEYALIKKYVAVGSLYSALEYIKNSPWLNLAYFLKYRLEYKQQHVNSLMHQASMVISQANSAQSNAAGVADASKSK